MNIELFLLVLPKIILYNVIAYYCIISMGSAFETSYEMDSLLAFFVALLVSATVGLLFYPMIIVGKLYMMIRYWGGSYNSVWWIYQELTSETTQFIFDGASKLSEFAKLRFTKRGRAKRERMLREELWNNEFYCGEL